MDQKCFSLTIKVSDKCPSTSPSAVPVKLDLFIHSPGISTPAKQIRHQVPGPQSTKPSLLEYWNILSIQRPYSSPFYQSPLHFRVVHFHPTQIQLKLLTSRM